MVLCEIPNSLIRMDYASHNFHLHRFGKKTFQVLKVQVDLQYLKEDVFVIPHLMQ